MRFLELVLIVGRSVLEVRLARLASRVNEHLEQVVVHPLPMTLEIAHLLDVA